MENEKRSSEWIIGLKVRIKTSLGEEVEGEIWSYDTVTNCVVLVHILSSIC
jgi:small nuclear ribonucleoprotein (snRNP)-like protein